MSSHTPLDAGRPVTVVCERNGARVSCETTVVRDLVDTVEVAIEGFSAERSGRPIALIVGDDVTSEFVSIQDCAIQAGTVTLETWGPWQRVSDRRSSARFSMSIACELRGKEHVVPGLCLDVSMDGVSIQTTAWDEPGFTLALQIGDRWAELPCTVVRLAAAEGTTEVHARFDDLSMEAGLALVGLVEASREASNAA